MEHHGQQVAETEAEDPHGDDGEDHGDLYVRSGAQCIRQREGQRPDRHNAGGMVQNNIVRVPGGLIGEVVDRQDKRQRQDHEEIRADQAEILDAHHVLCIVFYLLKIPRADALGANREKSEAKGHSGQDREVCDIVADRVRRQGRCSKTGDETQYGDLAKLEHAVLQSVRNSDIEDLFQHIPLDLKRIRVQDVEFMFLIVQQDKNYHTCNATGHHRRDRHALDTAVEPEDQQGISEHVDGVHEQRSLHGDIGVSHSAEDRGSGVVHGDHRDGRENDQQVCAAVLHDFRLDLSEYMVQDQVLTEVAKDHNEDREQECEVEKLGRRLTSGLRIFSSKVLSGNYSAAGGESREDIDDEQHDRVDQGNAGDGCLPDPGDYDRVGKADGNL